jgi:type IV secretory pathway TrbD component
MALLYGSVLFYILLAPGGPVDFVLTALGIAITLGVFVAYSFAGWLCGLLIWYMSEASFKRAVAKSDASIPLH